MKDIRFIKPVRPAPKRFAEKIVTRSPVELAGDPILRRQLPPSSLSSDDVFGQRGVPDEHRPGALWFLPRRSYLRRSAATGGPGFNVSAVIA
jgi:hypothetical protein